MTLQSVLHADPSTLTPELTQFLTYYYKYLPVLDSDCVMNRICHYIEDQDISMKAETRKKESFDHTIFTTSTPLNQTLHKQILTLLSSTFKTWKEQGRLASFTYHDPEDPDAPISKQLMWQALRDSLDTLTSSEEQLTNHLVHIFYIDKPSYNKSLLWYLVGKQMYTNLRSKVTTITYPVPADSPEEADFFYLYKPYKVITMPILDEDFLIF